MCGTGRGNVPRRWDAPYRHPLCVLLYRCSKSQLLEFPLALAAGHRVKAELGGVKVSRGLTCSGLKWLLRVISFIIIVSGSVT